MTYQSNHRFTTKNRFKFFYDAPSNQRLRSVGNSANWWRPSSRWRAESQLMGGPSRLASRCKWNQIDQIPANLSNPFVSFLLLTFQLVVGGFQWPLSFHLLLFMTWPTRESSFHSACGKADKERLLYKRNKLDVRFCQQK